MTETTQELLARLAGFTPGPCRVVESPGQKTEWGDQSHIGIWSQTRWDDAYEADPDDMEAADDAAWTCGIWGAITAEDRANAELYASAPDLHRIASEQAAEIARLRDALKKIAGCEDFQFWHVVDIARAALQVQP